ncbi:MAG: hypothetical protein K2X90_02575 [Candidatus Babeliaceae bacterium]|nr:hypothetical protein [Candidatus Babeliaceae bacterium]
MEITSTAAHKDAVTLKSRSYNDIIEYLDSHWAVGRQDSLERAKSLDQALNNPSKSVRAILVAGSNGKSLTINFAAKLLAAEGLKVGAYYSPHVLTYQERFVLNQTTISQKVFTDIANEVINAAEYASINAHSSELLALMALSYFKQEKVEVALLEVDNGGLYNPVNICNALVATITRIAEPHITTTPEEIEALTRQTVGIVKKNTYLVSGDQSKAALHIMQELTQAQGGHWLMPIRKVVALEYPFEQLHGRCAALAERIAVTFIQKCMPDKKTNLDLGADSLLVKQKIHRGRPTIEAKRQQELNPRKTVEQFWKEVTTDLPGKFQVLDKEKPTILLDNAHNIDAFKNLLLGIRLMHYQSALKGLSLVIGAAEDTLHNQEFVKLLRYFFKKTSGQLFICPIQEMVKGVGENSSWDVEQVSLDMKKMKIKAKACKNFEEAFEQAKKSVDDRHGLVVVTGSHAVVNAFWNYKGIKKF